MNAVIDATIGTVILAVAGILTWIASLAAETLLIWFSLPNPPQHMGWVIFTVLVWAFFYMTITNLIHYYDED